MTRKDPSVARSSSWKLRISRPCGSSQSCLAFAPMVFRILMKESVFIILNTPSPYKDSINDVRK